MPSVFAFRVTGKVQGVGFRWFTCAAADRLGVLGWVANHADGSVVGEAYGESATIDAFMVQLERGSSASVVHRVTRAVSKADVAAFTRFEIRQ